MSPRLPAPTARAAASPPRRSALLADPSFLRLWIAGGIGNAMRWLEMLVAGVFVFELTHSTFLVALVTVARTLPMFFIGPLAGVVGEAVNRKTLLVCGLFVMAASSGTLALLAGAGLIRVWHIALGGGVAGLFWASEMAVRRRMVSEVAAGDRVAQAIALDALTASVVRMLGPLVGGVVFERFGIGGAYLLSATLHLLAAIVVAGLAFTQASRPLRWRRIPAEIAEGLAIVRSHKVILAVVLVTIITNAFGFSYSALIAPIGLHKYGVSPVLVGALAAAEPFGAMVSGLALSTGWLRLDRRRGLLRGSFLFMAALALTALSPWYVMAFAVLLLGGLGTSAFSIMQSTLALTEAPAAMRSRVMGIITASIGTAPLGVLVVGGLSEWFGASGALLAMSLAGLATLSLVRLRLTGLQG